MFFLYAVVSWHFPFHSFSGISMHFFSFHLNLTTSWRKKYRGNYSLWFITAFYCGRKMLHTVESSKQENLETEPSINVHGATIAWKLSSENWFYGLLYITLLCCHLLICQWSQTNDTYNCDSDSLVLPSAHSKQGQKLMVWPYMELSCGPWNSMGIWCVVETYMLQAESFTSFFPRWWKALCKFNTRNGNSGNKIKTYQWFI